MFKANQLYLAILAISFSSISSVTFADDSVQVLPTIKALPLAKHNHDVISPINIIEQKQLLKGGFTLGNALENEVGVRSDTFGAGASRPVIRGQTAPRVKVLSSGNEVQDASSISPDHAVTVEPLLANSIEVIRGTATLVYGGGAVGGVVNVEDTKIPTKMPSTAVEGLVGFRAGNNDNEQTTWAGVTAGLGENIAVKVEGIYRDVDAYKAGRPDPEDNSRVVEGTQVLGKNGSIGVSWIGDSAMVGVAYTKRQDAYGIAGHSHEYETCHPHDETLHCGVHDEEAEPAEEHEHEEHGTPPQIKLDSDRYDLKAQLNNPIAGIKSIKFSGSYTDYQHQEMDLGEVTTTFKNKGHDTRLEVVHDHINQFDGVLGIGHTQTKFSALGDEAFVPTTDTQQAFIYALEKFEYNQFKFELGGRYEQQTITPDNAVNTSKFTGKKFDDSAMSASAGISWSFLPNHHLGLNISHSERLPSAQELYANGVHLATNTYEIGDATLGKETSQNIELSFKKEYGLMTFDGSIYQNKVSDYIYARNLDSVTDEHDPRLKFNLVKYSSADTTFRGAELALGYQLSDSATVTLFADKVRASLDAGGYLPRIPSDQIGLKLDTKWRKLGTQMVWSYHDKQNRLAQNESSTEGYHKLNMSTDYVGRLNATTSYRVFAEINNVFNEQYYNSSSFQNTLPQQGRKFLAGVQFKF